MQGDPFGNFTTPTPFKASIASSRGVVESYYLWCGQDAEIYWKGKYLRVPICAPRWGHQ